MDFLELIGVIMNKMIMYRDVAWDYDDDSSVWVELKATQRVKECAESCLEEWDCIKCENYKYILVIFDSVTKHIAKISYGKEEHNVKDLIERLVKENGCSNYYDFSCKEIFKYLPCQN